MGELKEVTIYTDGSCIGNSGPGGYGVVLQYGGHVKQLSGGFRLTTNNRMEIMAAIVGLEALKVPCSVTLYSDSKYLVDSMTEGWVQRWKLNNWWRSKKGRAANIDLWDKLLDVCAQHDVSFVWVKGQMEHTWDEQCHIWNEQCHSLAREAANQENSAVDEGYELRKGKHQTC